jgi:glycosyltransferase involved in cell wall biosynthesis
MTIHVFWFTTPAENQYDAYQYSNQEIVKNFMLEFSKYDDVQWHHSNSRERVTDNPNDILIGHPPWPKEQTEGPYANWVFDNGLNSSSGGTPTAHPNSFVVLPWGPLVSETHPSVDPFMEMILHSRALFGLGGLVHYDYSVEAAPANSIWRRTQSKLIRTNMGCDARMLPTKSADSPRTNGMLHVSSIRGYKRPELMFASLPPEGCTLNVGTESVALADEMRAKGLIPPNVNILGPIQNNDPYFNKMVLEECSFYLHVAREPQATTILENCARGLIPLLSRQSGFDCPDAIYLDDEDTEQNKKTIRDALAMPDDEFKQRRHGARSHVRMFHSWGRICEQIYAAMRTLIAGGDVDRRGEPFS